MCSLGYSAHLLLSQPLSSVFGWVWVSLSLKWGHSVLIQLYLHSPDLCSSLSWWSCLLLGVIFSRDLWNLLPLASRTLFFHLAVFMPLAMATPLFPHLFPMKWWDQMPRSSFSECWASSQLFHSPLNPEPPRKSCLVNILPCLRLHKPSSWPKSLGNKCYTACEALDSPSPRIAFPWLKGIKLITEL